MLKKNKKNIDSRHFKKQLILILIILTYILSLSFISGRYVLKKINSHLSASKEFYFYSDKLSEEQDTEYHINWYGNEECIIPINLYTKLNNLKTMEHDIKYKVEYIILTDNATCELSKEEGVVSSINNTDTFSISVTPTQNMNNGEKIEVEVIVSTVDNFEKILTRKFVINMGNEEVLYKIDDERGRAYFNLIINNSQKEKLTIEFNPSEVIIDVTNPIFENLQSYTLLSNTNYLNKVIFAIEPMSNTSIKFFKRDEMQNYTNSNDIINCIFE